ncbi:MAG: hypothetical protein R8M46_06195 [Ghiorsea sp.]
MSRMLAASTDNMEGLGAPAASSSRPNAPKPRIWLGVTKGLLEAKEAIENQNLDIAEQLLREILEFAPAEPETWHILAAILNRREQFDEARELLRRAIKLKDTNISLQTDLPVSKRMAKLLWAQEDKPAALTMLAELLLASPDDKELEALHQTWTHTS